MPETPRPDLYSRARSTASVISSVPTSTSAGRSDIGGVSPSTQARSGVRRPRSSALSTATSTRSASSAPVEPVAQHHRDREEGREWVGDALAGDVGRRAVDRLVHARAALLAEARRGQHPERAGEHRRLVAEDVAEHVLGQDHVEARRLRDELHRRVVDEQVVELDVGELGRDALDGLAPQARRLEHVGLVHRRHAGLARRRAPARSRTPPARCARSRRPCTRTCRRRRRRAGPSRRSRSRPSARARPAGLCPRCGRGATGWRAPATGSAGRGAGWRRGPCPCEARAGPARGAARRGRSCPTSGRRRRRAAPRRTRGRPRGPRRSAPCRARRSRRRRRGARSARSRRGRRAAGAPRRRSRGRSRRPAGRRCAA